MTSFLLVLFSTLNTVYGLLNLPHIEGYSIIPIITVLLQMTYYTIGQYQRLLAHTVITIKKAVKFYHTIP